MRPRKYRIEGEWVDVIWRATLKRFRDGYPTAGRHTPETSTTRAKIEIAPGQTHDDERRTLLHEMLHDAASRGNVRSFMTIRDEETFITAMEPWLYFAIQQNPELVGYLMERRPE
jgi:hypothetical protein